MSQKLKELIGKKVLPKSVPQFSQTGYLKKENIVFWSGSGKIIPHQLFDFFGRIGIGKYYPDDSSWKNTEPVIVKINGNVVSEINIGFLLETAKRYIYEYLDGNGEIEPVMNSLHKSVSLFGERNLKLLPTLKLDFISDNIDSGYLFFNNGIVQVFQDKVELKNYDDFDQYIWEKNIINLDFQQIDYNELVESCDFMKFLHDISVIEDKEKSESRLKSLRSAIGYLLHRYKDGTTNKSIILMDVYVNGTPNGGSGKSLLIKSIGKIRNLAEIDGKKYDQREWFALSSVGLDSEVLLFDDVTKDFDFEQLFPLTSGGMLVRRKYKEHIHIPHEKSPKIALTTNYAINGNSDSHRRRKFEFELSSTFSADFSPRDKFGKNFFDEWTNEEWNLFYNTMIQCITVYLKNGLYESEPINIQLTKLINSTNEEFVEFANFKIKLNKQLDKKILFKEFVEEFPEYRNLKQRSFTQWLHAWGKYNNLNLMEGHTGEIRYIIFSEN